MINRCVLVGRMTKNPELRRTNTGTPVTSFTLACNRTFKSADGQDADFIPCVIWNKGAENVERYCSKGSLVGVEGRLQSRSYDNSHGQKVFVVEVVCDSVQFLETKKENTGNQANTGYPQSYPQQQSYQQQYQQNDFISFKIDPDDIQF